MIGPLVWWGVDDANITYAFAENIAHGHGYTFGHEDPVVVEGSTSLLWTLLLSAVAALGVPINIAAITLGSLFAAGSAILAAAIVRRMGATPVHALAAGTLYLLTPGVIEWQALSGLESGLWSVAVLLTWFLLAHGSSLTWQSIALGVMILTRPESMLYAPVMIALAFMMHRASSDARIRTVVIQVLAVTVVLLAVTVMRMLVFDAPVPNTYYAKVGTLAYNLANGTRYATSVFMAMPLPWLMLGYVLIVDRRWLRSIDPLVVMALLTFIQPIMTGGDHFNLGRFSQIHWPWLWMIVVAWIMHRSWSFRTRLGVIVLVAVTVQVAPSGILRSDRALLHGSGAAVINEYRIGEKGRAIGQTLSRMFPHAPRPRVGVLAAGGVAWTYHGPVRDLLGLCNPDVRNTPPATPSGVPNHDAFSMALLRTANVDLMNVELITNRIEYQRWIADNADNPASFDNAIMKGALRDPEYRRMFVPAMLSRGKDTICALVSRAWIADNSDVSIEIVEWRSPE
jgi:hypothetical protein